MKKITLALAAILGTAAAARADHETLLVGEVAKEGCGHEIDGVEIVGEGIGDHVGKRVEISGSYGAPCRRCRKKVFKVTSCHELCDEKYDLVVSGSIASRARKSTTLYVGYMVAGQRFDPSSVRGVQKLCEADYAVRIRPRKDENCGTKYAVVAWTDECKVIWDGCGTVRVNRSGWSGCYTFARGRWTDPCGFKLCDNEDGGVDIIVR